MHSDQQVGVGIPRRTLRVSEARAALGIGKTTIYALLKTGKLASVRIGTVRLIPVEAIEALLNSEKA